MYTVESIMKSPVIGIDGEATVREAMHLMRQNRISGILVKAEGAEEYSGIMTKRDIITKVVAKGLDPDKVQVKEVMHPLLITVPPTCSLKEASALMIQHNVRRIPIVDGGKIVGIVTDTDIFAAVEERGWGLEH